MLRPYHIRALERAIREAASWRGSLTGDPDPEPLREFDQFISHAQEALKRVKEMNSREKAQASAKITTGVNHG